ncbi:unnamed protein product [Cyberlindnera jadinii]|uniref:Exonuclease domain-containing protein n=2 Tax=Cyberlindnera jadinii (strain ATCC 18201 / CBS 1600 / BCRC 20928 / JCM 3617 / NBRC 0987 / NRRL Y-1542) TaxID=983966 RepID=A0A0H5C8U5_CYBJN|nr:unnamed protein product [Cyberlindnera jadinii]
MSFNPIESNVSGLVISSTAEEKAHNESIKAKRRRSSAARSSISHAGGAGKKVKGLKAPRLDLVQQARSHGFNELRDLALFVLGASNESVDFVSIKQKSNVECVVIVLVPGIGASEFVAPSGTLPCSRDGIPRELPFLKEAFDQMVPMKAPGDRESIFPLMQAFTKRRYTKKQKENVIRELSVKKLVLPDLAASYEEMLANNYPIHNDLRDEGATIPEGWAETFEFEHDGSHTFAMDCEMCESKTGKVLTRISLIDFTETVLIDEYVKPEEEITDYLTKYSGITEELLKDVTTTLKDIQKKIQSIVSSKDYLIGHSLENDLNVMKIMHPNIVDTSLIFEHPRGPPFKSSLKYLTKQYLKRVIQEGEHDSVEDSKACLELVKLKLSEGGLLGKVIDGELIFNDLMKIDKKALILDFQRVQAEQNRYITCLNDDDVVAKTISKIAEYDLIVANLKEVEFAQENGQFTEESKSELYNRLNDRLRSIYESIPPNSLVAFSMCHGDQTTLKQMRENKKKYRNELKDKGSSTEFSWSLEDDLNLKQTAAVTREGVTFIKIKSPTESALV